MAIAVIGGWLAFQAQALPRYSARYEQTCALCHINPTGGGMRSSYASQELAPKELAWSPGAPTSLAEIEPRIAKHIGIGADFRELYLAESPESPQANQQGFFLMQGNTYLSFELDPRFTLYFARGVSNTYETFGLAYPKPWLYLKAGRFTPSYGWKFDDHTMFVRSETGFMPPAHTDVGLELGLTPKRLDLQLALLNGNRGDIQDNDRNLAAAANLLARFRIGPVGAAAGVSGYHHPGRVVDLDIGGTYGYLTLGNLTWLGQSDWMRRDPTGGNATTALVSSQEVTWLLHQGLELRGTYDYLDADVDVRSGAKWRWGGGVTYMPRSFLVLEALYRDTHVDAGPALTQPGFQEGVVQLHLLY